MNIFELSFRLKGFPLEASAKELQKVQSMNKNAFLEFQKTKQWEIARFHYDHNIYYRNKVGAHFPDRWEDLPIMTKSDFQRPMEEILSEGYTKDKLYISNTSGSSGHPFFFAKDKFSHALTWVHLDSLYKQHGLRFFSRQARFYGIPLGRISFYSELLKDWLANRKRFTVFDLSESRLEEFLSRFRKDSFECVYGYTSSIVYFCRWLILKKITLKTICPTLRVVITTSESLTPEDRKIIEQGTGVYVVNEYGASETGIIGFQDTHGKLRVSEELLYAEIKGAQPDSDKAQGELLLTSLYNKAMPFVRYQIGDVATLRHDSEEKYTWIESLDGRVNDFAKLPSGKTAPGMTFYYISRSILESGGGFKEFIIRQTAINCFEFDVVSDAPLSETKKEEVIQIMNKYLEPGLKLIIHQVDKINRPNSGKIKHFYYQVP
jgi:phenylacetate-CoA ligase